MLKRQRVKITCFLRTLHTRPHCSQTPSKAMLQFSVLIDKSIHKAQEKWVRGWGLDQGAKLKQDWSSDLTALVAVLFPESDRSFYSLLPLTGDVPQDLLTWWVPCVTPCIKKSSQSKRNRLRSRDSNQQSWKQTQMIPGALSMVKQHNNCVWTWKW